MSYLLDTNIISETAKTNPNKSVINWLNQIPSEDLFISVLTIGEIKQGVEKLAHGKKRNELLHWVEFSLHQWFGMNSLPITKEVAERWGFLNAHHKKTLPTIDSLLAATALTHNLKLVTRNKKDFIVEGLEVINPFA